MKRICLKIIVLFLVLLVFFGGCRPSREGGLTHPVPQEASKYVTHEIFIPRGGSIFTEMTRVGLTPNQVVDLIEVFGDNVDFRTVQPNDHFRLIIDPETNVVVEFNFMPDIVTTHRIVRCFETNSYYYVFEEKEITTRMLVVEGVVYTTLDQALANSNVDNVIRHAVTNALSSRINFSAHTRAGDTFKIMYSERQFAGNRVPGSRLYYISYNGRTTGFHEGFRFTDSDERSAFNGMYTPQGVAMTNATFRLPLDRIHVSSPFGN